jgi:hypothetical protein
MFRWFTIIAIFLSIFSYSYIFSREPFEFYVSYVIYIMYFPIFFVKFGVPKWPVLLFLPLLFFGIIYCQIGLNTYQQFLKIFIGFFASVLFYHYVVQVFDHDLKQLYRFYLKACYIISIIGIFQLFSYFVGFTPGYKYHWIFNKWNVTTGGLGIRVNAIFSEPAYYAATLAPAFFTSVYNISTRYPIFLTRFQSYVTGVAYLLTFSSLGIGAVFMTIILLLINFGFIRYALVFIPLLIFTFNYAYKNVDEFRDRYDGTFEIYTTDNIYSYDIHGSSFVLYNNSHVAWQNFIRNPFFGTGLGSHPIAFDKYSLTNNVGAVQIDFNKMDANSMFLRLMSETGLYGLIMFMMLLFRCWVFKQRTADRELWVMSNSLALIIILYLVRQGHYFLNGFPFFIWLYYYTAVTNWRARKKAKEEEEALATDSDNDQLPSTTVRGPIVPMHT